ncbi:MAG: lysophospholipid acyltransferase family protein [Clostridia bacterium]
MKKPIQKRPNVILYSVGGALLKAYCKIKYRMQSNKIKLSPDGGLILANHQSSLDAFIMLAALYPNRLNSVAAYYYFLNKYSRAFLNMLGVIPKYQFSSDYESVKKMLSVVKNKGYLALMPEGTVPMTGKMEYVAPSIASLIKLLKTNVYTCKIDGSSLACPKWAKYDKKGKVVATTKLLFNKEEVAKLSVDEILKKIKEALWYDDFEYLKENNLTFKGKAKAEGLEKLIHICPHCLDQGSMKTEGDAIFCSKCGLKATLDDKLQLHFNAEQYFDDFYQWYKFQENIYNQEVIADDFVMTDKVKYLSQLDGNPKYTCISEGVMTLNSEGFRYKDNDNALEMFYPIAKVPMVVLDAGKNFELPYDNGIKCFEPEDKTKVIKWYGVARILFDLNQKERKDE